MLEIQLPARDVLTIFGNPVTDAQIGALIVGAIVLIVGGVSARRFSVIPSRMQVIMEYLYDMVERSLEGAFGTQKEARRYTPLFLTTLLVIAIANQLVLLPVVFELLYEGTPLVRQPTSDLSGTVALALVMVVGANILALMASPRGHLSSFFPIGTVLKARSFGDFFQACIGMFIGGMNIIGECAKVISLSCRLFGNIFAGNVMVAVIMSLAAFTAYLVPIPFMILGVFSGAVQAYVFMTLTIQFMAGSVVSARQAATS